MGSITLYLSIFISPVLALLLLFYLKRFYDKKRYIVLLKAFAVGCVIVVIPLIFQRIAHYYGYDDLRNLKRIVFFSFILVGFFTEFGKFLVLRYIVYPYKSFDGPSDGIIFSIVISLGFTSVSSLLYVFELFDTAGGNPTLIHAYSIGVANIFFAIVLGFFLGMAKLGHNIYLNSLLGLGAASLFHGLYEFCLITRDYKLLSVVVFGFMFLGILLLLQTVRGKIEDKRTEVNEP